MSTTFYVDVEKRNLVRDNDGNPIYNRKSPFEDHNGFEMVAFRNSHRIRFLNRIARLLPNDIEVYALDNSPQGIYTIGDILQEIAEDIV